MIWTATFLTSFKLIDIFKTVRITQVCNYKDELLL